VVIPKSRSKSERKGNPGKTRINAETGDGNDLEDEE